MPAGTWPPPDEGEARRRHARRIQSLHSRLRGFLRYLFSQGGVDRNWALALRSPRRYRLAATPRPLPVDQVLRVLESVDRPTAPGKRDFALLLLAAGLGLRASDLAALRLERLRWRRQVVCIEQPKTGNFLDLPLSDPLSQALADYVLQERRRDGPWREVFLRSRSPWAPLSAARISAVMAQRLRQAGVRGTGHQFRHTLAGELLAAGVGFFTLQEVLGHRQITSTQVYTKIDLCQLREVAHNDAGGY